ncbi:unnamed protein product [Lupinus luteus]|uniref:CCHC-type domain-containing protein n=1 Tax=Lupinus luteus TaxID=3873 RepID=A0AAV1YAP3_LUPLU
MDMNERIAHFFNRMISHTNQMKAYGEVITDQKIIEKILRTLTPNFDHIVVAIEESRNLEELKLEELQGSLEAHEQRLIERFNDKSMNQALQAQSFKRGNYKNRGERGNRGKSKEFKGRNSNSQSQNEERIDYDHPNSTSTGRGGFKSWRGGKKRIDRRKIKCFNCNKIGHFSSECQASPNHFGFSSNNQNEAHMAKEEIAEKDEERPVLLMMTTNLVERLKA